MRPILACLALAVAALTLSACGDDDHGAGTVTVHFDHEVGGLPLTLDPTTTYTNAAGNVYSVSLLEYIVTAVDLVRADGAAHRLRDAHYRNASVPATGSFTALDVPSGDYSALRFTFGVAGDGNVFGALPNNAEFNNMEWPAPMGGGYHYMRMEGLFDSSGQPTAFLSHTGPAGGGDFSFAVELPLTLTVDGDDQEIHLAMDVNEWFRDPYVYDFTGRGMIMGNADAQLTLQANGATVFRVEEVGPAHDHAD